MAAIQSPAALEAFYCFNSEFGPHESNEHEKVLYHYPETVAFEMQMREIGLCEAVINITRTFNPKKLCEAMHTQKRKQSFFEAEPDFWMVLVRLLLSSLGRAEAEAPRSVLNSVWHSPS